MDDRAPHQAGSEPAQPRLTALRPYQLGPFRAILRSIRQGLGLTFTVMMSRQAGKNELSAQLELLLLALDPARGGTIVKCAPTFRPQAINSIERLRRRLDQAGFAGWWRIDHGYQIRLGRARAIFFSADRAARVVGHTADRLLEIDEAQDVDPEKYARDFRPMGATANVTTVLYGTPWDESTLLAQTVAHNLDLEARDGIRRHFAADWRTVADHVPAYGAFVANERARLGEDHPIFRTQYALESIADRAGLFPPDRRARLRGDHPRQTAPLPDRVYVAGLDLAGEAALGRSAGDLPGDAPAGPGDGPDSSVLTIAELDFDAGDPAIDEPTIRIVDHVRTTGIAHPDLYTRLIDRARLWRLRRLVVDATGLGQPIAGFLAHRLGGLVDPFVFSAPSKSRLAFELLAAVNTGRVRIYADDSSPESREFWLQIERARAEARPNQTLNFFVDPRQGHDDFLISLALTVRAAAGYRPRVARGRLP